ncbi:MAG: hypothetical protein LBQ61_05400 [Spirochaetales bacterium]|jgi:hypothetical protein|nr:hypothetical protein [Spirochaetales bacterium]
MGKTTIPYGSWLCIVILLTTCRSLQTPLGIDEYLHVPPGEDINGIFPEAVYIKTRTQTFNTYHYYLVQDGLIWYKSIDETKEPVEWTLFEKTGLPHDSWKIGFNKPERIVEISADADELVALSDQGGFYRFCFDKIISHKSNVWFDRQGWPVAEQLFLDNRTKKNIAWALGKRNNQVLYYEDPFGNQHHNGTMEIATTYMLLEDGQEICYADTGLPGDFSRNFIGPEGGAFKALALSASGSTMFVMNDAGEMYTRIADFDIVGCDPMWFKYTYVPYESDEAGTNYFSNLTEWGLPSEDWRAQPRIPLNGNAMLSRHITILQNGQGNAARELRVAGINEAGETGYWTKGIFDDSWIFRTVPLYFSPGSLLPTGEDSGKRGEPPVTAFRGFWWNGYEKEDDVVYEIPNFNVLEGSCELRISRQGEVHSLTLYPVELWTYQKRDFLPGRTGPPKMFLGTLGVDENALTGLSDSFAGFIRERFGQNDRKLFQYTLAAKNNFCLLRDRDKEDSVVFLTDGTISGNFSELTNTQYIDYSDVLLKYHSAELTIEDSVRDVLRTPGELYEKIEGNKNLRNALKARINGLERLKVFAFFMSFGYLPLDGIIKYSPLRFVDLPKLRTMTRFGETIVLINGAAINHLSDIETWVYQKIIDSLDLRIDCYTGIAKHLREEPGPVSPPPWFSEQITDYWDIAGLPHEIEGVFFSPQHNPREIPAVLTFTPQQGGQQVFGWHLTVGQAPSWTLFVDPQKSAKTIYQRGGKSPGERSVRIDCTAYINPGAKTGPEQTVIEQCLEPFIKEGRPGLDLRIIFDGEEFEIREYPPSHSSTTIFRGKALF